MKTLNFTRQSNTKPIKVQCCRTVIAMIVFVFASPFLQAQDMLMGLTSNGGPQGMGTAFSFRPDTKAFTVVNSFANWGENPVSSLVKGSDGAMYGMTPTGGTYGNGSLFRITTGGSITMLKQFNMAVDGGYPKGSLIQGKDGFFYGTTENGGPNSGGVLFKINSSGQYFIVRSLNYNTDGGRPAGHLIQANDGNFYGVTRAGGSTGYGTIFQLKPDGTYTVLKTFNYTADGGNCYGSLVQGKDSALYGMTRYGGTYGYGVIFRITLDGKNYRVLKHLNSATDAGYPLGDIIQARDGYLYGLASTGIAYNGVAFKIKTDGSSFSLLHQFNPTIEGGSVAGSLVQGQGTDNNFYGLTQTLSGGYAGSVFQMKPDGTVTPLKKFTQATDGGGSVGSLIQMPDGYFYGMTQYGGKNDDGTIFKVSASGLTFNVLANMNGASIGNSPQDNLALAKDSAYYGVSREGGLYNWGTVYKICGGVTTVLKSFNKNAEGGNPSAGLVKGKDGNLYGATETGGTNGGGTIFRINPSTGAFSVIRHLKSTTDGEGVRGTLALAPGTDSALYGITYGGGTGNAGTIFKITLKGVFTVLRNFVPATDGDHSEAGLTFKDSVFYGFTGYNSRFFKINPNGHFTVIKTLVYNTDGNTPLGNMIIGTDGNFYGTMSTGGTNGKGLIFKMTTSGTMTKLKYFNGTTEGSYPRGSVVQTADGALYGTTFSGGANGVGVIYKFASGTLTVLKNFNMATDGGNSLSGMIIAPKIALVANAQSSLTTNEDVAKTIALAGTGATTIAYNIVTSPKHGKVSTGTGASRTYTPSANYYGVDSFAFTTSVGCLSSTPAWVKITVTSVNDAPVLAAIGNKTLVLGTTLTFTATATDVDAGQTKTFSLVTPPSGASISATSGAFSWKPTTVGTYTFKVRVTDNGSPVLYDEETITVTVTAPALTTISAASTHAGKPEELNATPTASLYPNPVVSSFTLAWKNFVGPFNLIITDAKGAVVYSKQYNGGRQVQVTDAALKPGLYVAVLQTGSTTQSLKFVKQ